MILHVDMDAFYASVEEREDPSLVGKPVIVGGTAAGRGVVAAANYEARKYGVHSAMASARAQRLCPQAVVIRPRIDFYAAVSRQIQEIFSGYTPIIEPLSLDEAFLDVAGSEQLFGSATNIGHLIKTQIRDELRLVASIGVAPNKFLAKIASDIRKPDGFVIVGPDQVQSFLDPLPVSRLWGVGKVTGGTFARLGLQTIGQLRRLTATELTDILGSAGEHFWRLAHGIDERPVVPDRDAKSISHETTFAEDIQDDELLLDWLAELVDQVARRLRGDVLKRRTIEIKIRSADFQTVTRSVTLREATNITSALSHLNFGIDGFQFTAGVGDFHLPVDAALLAVDVFRPGGDLGAGISGRRSDDCRRIAESARSVRSRQCSTSFRVSACGRSEVVAPRNALARVRTLRRMRRSYACLDCRRPKSLPRSPHNGLRASARFRSPNRLWS